MAHDQSAVGADHEPHVRDPHDAVRVVLAHDHQHRAGTDLLRPLAGLFERQVAHLVLPVRDVRLGEPLQRGHLRPFGLDQRQRLRRRLPVERRDLVLEVSLADVGRQPLRFGEVVPALEAGLAVRVADVVQDGLGLVQVPGIRHREHGLDVRLAVDAVGPEERARLGTGIAVAEREVGVRHTQEQLAQRVDPAAEGQAARLRDLGVELGLRQGEHRRGGEERCDQGGDHLGMVGGPPARFKRERSEF